MYKYTVCMLQVRSLDMSHGTVCVCVKMSVRSLSGMATSFSNELDYFQIHQRDLASLKQNKHDHFCLSPGFWQHLLGIYRHVSPHTPPLWQTAKRETFPDARSQKDQVWCEGIGPDLSPIQQYWDEHHLRGKCPSVAGLNNIVAVRTKSVVKLQNLVKRHLKDWQVLTAYPRFWGEMFNNFVYMSQVVHI